MEENRPGASANELASTFKLDLDASLTLALATEAEAKAATSNQPNFIIVGVSEGRYFEERTNVQHNGGGSSDLNVTIY
jgi:hypothetical protein